MAAKVLNTPEGTRAFFSEYATGTMIRHEMKPEELEYILDVSARTPYWVCKALFCDAIFSNYLPTAKELGENFPSLMFIGSIGLILQSPSSRSSFRATKPASWADI